MAQVRNLVLFHALPICQSHSREEVYQAQSAGKYTSALQGKLMIVILSNQETHDEICLTLLTSTVHRKWTYWQNNIAWSSLCSIQSNQVTQEHAKTKLSLTFIAEGHKANWSIDCCPQSEANN